MPESIGIAGLGLYAPPEIVTADRLAEETGIPADILYKKFGVRQVHRAGPDCHVSDMAIAAGHAALEDAGIAPEDIDLVVYCGSEYKDYIVWSAARGLLRDGDVVVLVAAGVGYTWSAGIVRWGQE